MMGNVRRRELPPLPLPMTLLGSCGNGALSQEDEAVIPKQPVEIVDSLWIAFDHGFQDDSVRVVADGIPVMIHRCEPIR